MAQAPLTIGRLACSAGVNVETVRYYQRWELIIEPQKPACGFRYYPAETVTRIQFIERAQRLGFTLQEIGKLLDLGDGHCGDIHELAERKYSEIERQINELLALGIGGTWISSLTALEPYRPVFIGITLVFLFLAFRKLYLVPAACAPGDACAVPATRRNQRLIFWVVTLLLIALLTFPYTAAHFLPEPHPTQMTAATR